MLALLAFALRALIPAGFMPGGKGLLTLQICPEGIPAAVMSSLGDHSEHAHHHHAATDAEHATHQHSADSSGAPSHDHKSWASGHCAFAATASAPPLWHASVLNVSVPVAVGPFYDDAPLIAFDLRFRVAQPRAPPRLA